MAKDDKVVPAKRKKLARKEAEAFAGGIPSGMTPNGHFHQGHSLLSSSSAPAPGSRPLISSSAPPSSCRYAALGTHPTALQGVTHQQRGESLQFRPGKIVYKPHKLPPKPSPATLDAAPGNSWTHPHRRAQSQGASTGGVYGQELGYAGGAYGGAGGSASSASMGGHGGDDDARAPGGGGPANGFCMGMNAAEFAAIWAAPVPNLQASTSNATGKTKKSRRGPSDRRSRRGGYEEDNFGSSITNRKKIKKCKGKDNDKGKGKAVQGSTSSARGASPPPSSRGGALAAHHDQQQLVANSEDVDKFAIPRQKARVALSFGSLTTEDGEKLLEKICAGKEAAKVDLQRLVRDVVVQRNSRAAKQDIDDLVEIIIEISLELVIGHQGDAVPFASTICDRIFDRLEEWGTELRDLIVKTADSYLLLVGAPSLSQFLARSQGAGPPPSTAASAAAPSQPQHVDNNVAPLPVPQHPFPQPIANPSQQAPSPPQPALEAPIINHQQAPYFSQQFDQADFDVKHNDAPKQPKKREAPEPSSPEATAPASSYEAIDHARQAYPTTRDGVAPLYAKGRELHDAFIRRVGGVNADLYRLSKPILLAAVVAIHPKQQNLLPDWPAHLVFTLAELLAIESAVKTISTIDPSPYAVLQAVQLIALQGFLVEHPPPIEEEQTSEDVPTTWHITEDGIHLALYLAASNTPARKKDRPACTRQELQKASSIRCLVEEVWPHVFEDDIDSPDASMLPPNF